MVHDRARECDLEPLALRESRRAAIDHRFQSELLHQEIHAGADVRRRQPVQPREVLEMLASGQARVQTLMIEQRADRLVHLRLEGELHLVVGVVQPRVGTERHRRMLPRDHVQHRRDLGLAGADVDAAQVEGRAAVALHPGALVEHGPVPGEAEALERAQDLVRSARLLARPVEVLHAQEPLAFCRARLHVACQRGNQRPEVQRPRGRGGESADVLRHGARVHCALYRGAGMATVELTKDNFEKVVTESPIVIVDFWAPWCGPCRGFAPVYERAAETHADVVFGKVNTDAEQELAGAFNIRSIPTLMVFREKVVLFQQAGALPASALEQVIAQTKSLDMAKVHQEIAEREAQASGAKS